MAKERHELIIGVPDGSYLVTQDLLSSDYFDSSQISRMVAMGTESQVGVALVAVNHGCIQVMDGVLPETFVRLVLNSDQERGFTCLEPTTRLVARYSYVPVREA